MQDVSSAVAFDGTDPRFPDLRRFPLQAGIFSAAADLARRFQFRLFGVEHLMHELLDEPGFGALIQSAGGDVDACRGSLARSFREHHQFSSASPSLELSAEMNKLVALMGEDFKGPDADEPETALADFYLKVVRAALGSMIAESALQDCGAGSLLLDAEDVDFYQSDYDYIASRNAEAAESAQQRDTALLDKSLEDFDDAMLFGEEKDANPPLADLVNKHRAEKAAEKPQSNNSAGRRAGRSEADVGKDVDACLLDLGAKAARGDIDPVVGRDEEIDRIISVLRRRRKSSIILSGEAGVGKTAIAEGLALRLRSAATDKKLAGRPFYELALQDLVAGTKFRGDFEERMKILIARLRDEKAILFVDEFHMVVGSGSTYGRGMDGANMLKTALGRGEITVIGATTPAEMRELRQDAALMRRFDTMQIKEPTREEAIEILGGAAWSYLSHHDLEDTEGVVEEICRITDLYQPERRFPDKAFDLLDTACVVAVEEAAGRHASEEALLTIEHVREAADRLGLRRPKMPSEDEIFRLTRLEASIHDRLSDQKAAIAEISEEARAAVLNLDVSGPVSSMLLAGPAAAAPTRVARAFASAMELPFVRIDMGQMRDRSSMHQLIGLPGAVGADRTGQLVEAGDGHRDLVLMLENIERSDQAVQELVSEVLKTGMFRAADGRLVSLRGAWIFMSCICDPAGSRQALGFAREREENEDLRSLLDAGLLAAARRVIRLAQPSQGLGHALASAEFAQLAATFREMGFAVVMDKAAMDVLAAQGAAKAIRAAVQGRIRNLVVSEIWKKRTGDGIRIGLDPAGDGFAIR
ncbi:AAA family ATPase [Leisingera caerulea]|uniref:AAA family ATPase n=1 Tax=Leisingera caerulea TaxID=506591 RepID=UPI0012B6684F|nr:AAA family ATPase [Leisingera caerulea]